MHQGQKLYWIALLIFTAVLSVIISSNVIEAYADSSPSKLTYGCARIGPSVRCDPLTNIFNSLTTVGHVQRITTINTTKFDPTDGVFGDALIIQGYKQQYLTIANLHSIDPRIFSVSLWVKQDPTFRGNSSIISHVNSKKTAGWSLDHVMINSKSLAQFSTTNSDGKIFSVSAPIDADIFTNIIGVFDGSFLSIYANGLLGERIPFAGKYAADPNVPLNIGLNSYDYGRPEQ